MAKYRMYQNKNHKSSGFNKWYAHKASQGLVTMDQLVAHMAGHNSGFSKGQIMGIVTDMVDHVRELAYEGKSVKIDNLGIFRVSMRSKGVDNPKDFNAATDIQAKWQVQATGDVTGKTLGVTRAAGAPLVWEEVSDYQSPRTKKTGDTSGTPAGE